MRERDRAAALEEIGGSLRAAEAIPRRVLVAGASGFTGALARRARLAPPAPGAGRRHLAQRRRHAARRLYPRYRVPLELTELDLDAAREASTRRSSPTRTGPRRRSSPRCAALGLLVVDLSADFRLRDLRTYERWYGEHGAPELLDERRLRADRALPRASCASAELVADPGCYPTAACSRWRRCAERGLIATS